MIIGTDEISEEALVKIKYESEHFGNTNMRFHYQHRGLEVAVRFIALLIEFTSSFPF